MMLRKQFLAALVLSAAAVMFMGCNLIGDDDESKNDNNSSSSKLSDSVDFQSYPTNYSLHVKNNSSNKLIAFKGAPSQKQLIGGIPASGDHYLKKDASVFTTTTDFMLYVVTEDDYNTYYASSPETLDASPYTILYAFYNTATTNEQTYEISSKLGGAYQIVINNGTSYNVELRNMGPTGDIIGYSGSQTYEKAFHVTEGEYMIFPVFRKYDRNTGEIISTYPTYATGNLAGEAKSYEFSLDTSTKTRQFNVRDWATGINFTPSATYIKIINNADQGIQFFTGADTTPVVTSTGGKRINTSSSLVFAINMDKLTSNKYESERIVSGYRVATNRLTCGYLAGSETTDTGSSTATVTYKAGYLYTYTISGDAESGYKITPLTETDSDGNTILKAQEIDWSSI
ncbi:MAG: hypothetical protein IJ558_00385 [Treponema sp.]|nr:hypothetical protein [Treponema sp.]